MIPGINAPFSLAAEATGASVDELKLIFCFLLSYPLAAVLKRLPDAKPWQKNVFSCGISIFYLVGLFNLWHGIWTLFLSSAATYLIAFYVDGSLMPWIVFIFVMGHMSVSHVYRQIVADPRSVDVTGAQMVLVMKLSSFAWQVHDGRLKPSEMTDEQKVKAIYKFPSLLNYAGFVLFFPSVFPGPAFDYNDYEAWLTTTMFEVKPGDTAPPTRKKRRVPRSGTPATMKLVEGLFWIVLYLQLSGWYNNDTVLDRSYVQKPFFRRMWLLYIFQFTSRLKYYGVWALTEGACIMSGLGYAGIDPKTKKPLWNRLNNVDPWGIEFAQNSRAYVGSWNKNTNNWLRNCIYLRVTPKGKRPGFRASLATFATSAFWHGFYPGYYLTFVLGAFVQTVAKNFRRYVRPFFMTPDGTKATKYKIYYDLASWFVTQVTFCFVTMPFVILGFSDSIRVWGRVYFYVIIGVATSMAFFASPAKAYLNKAIKQRSGGQRPGHGLQRQYSSEQIKMPVLGMSDDPAREIDEAITEIAQEIEARKRRGSKIEMPSGEGLIKAVEERLRRRHSGEILNGSEKVKVDLNIGQGLLDPEIKKEK